MSLTRAKKVQHRRFGGLCSLPLNNSVLANAGKPGKSPKPSAVGSADPLDLPRLPGAFVLMPQELKQLSREQCEKQLASEAAELM